MGGNNAKTVSTTEGKRMRERERGRGEGRKENRIKIPDDKGRGRVATLAETFPMQAAGSLKTLAKQRFVINLVKRFSSSLSCRSFLGLFPLSLSPSHHRRSVSFPRFSLRRRARKRNNNKWGRSGFYDAANNFLPIAAKNRDGIQHFREIRTTARARALQSRSREGRSCENDAAFNYECSQLRDDAE